MLDYSMERHKKSPAESIYYVSSHKGLAIGNGLVFYLLHFLPIIGWVLGVVDFHGPGVEEGLQRVVGIRQLD